MVNRLLKHQAAERGARIVCGVSEDGSGVLPADCKDLKILLDTICCSHTLEDDEYELLFGEAELVDLGLDAAELLASANARDAIPAIFRFFLWLEDEEEVEALAADGPAIVKRLALDGAVDWIRCVLERKQNEWASAYILEGLKHFGTEHPCVRPSLVPWVLKGLETPERRPPSVNAELVQLAIDWQLTAAAEAIERAFSANRIDCGVAGNWEAVRGQLGVAGLGLPMPRKPVDSQEQLRRDLGIGAFSSEPLVIDGEVQETAADRYLEAACRAFLKSAEFAELSSADDYPHAVHHLLEYGLYYLDANVENMTPGDVAAVLLEHFPAHVAAEASDLNEVIDQLVAFWRYCDREHGIEHAGQLADHVQKLEKRFRRRMADPQCFGFAKSLVMAGRQAGFDMDTEKGINEFLAVYSRSQLAELACTSHDRSYDGRCDGSHASAAPPATSLAQRKKILTKKLARKR